MPSPALTALHDWPFAVWLRASPFAYPTLETLHILCIGLLFGSIVLVDWRILRPTPHFNLTLWLRSLLPWTLAAFVGLVATGGLMFIARASDLISNRAFVLKIILIFVAGMNAGILHSRGVVDPSSGLTRAQAGLSILLWIAIICCGRWIAYV